MKAHFLKLLKPPFVISLFLNLSLVMLDFQTTQSPYADDEHPLLIRLNFQYSSLSLKQCRILDNSSQLVQ